MEKKYDSAYRPLNKPNAPSQRSSSVFDPFQVHGKVPPHSLDLEQAVLGALLTDKDALTAVMHMLKTDSFYEEKHQIIFNIINDLFETNFGIDALTVASKLPIFDTQNKVGGLTYLLELTSRVASTANLEFHARILSQKYFQRELIRVGTEIVQEAFEPATDAFVLIDKVEKKLFEITQSSLTRSYHGLATLAPQALNLLRELAKKSGNFTGVPSGFKALDSVTSGWQASDLVIVAARPGMGKTSFNLAIARNAAVDFQKPVAFFSLEMSSLQLVSRLISMESEIPSERMRQARLEEHEWRILEAKTESLQKAKIFIDDTAGLSVFELRAKCRRLKAQEDIQLIIIDYLQLMTAGPEHKSGNREQEISTISRSLKALAKELNVPVIALSQLSRAVETRGGSKRPQLSDLRESGAIEQDADIVSFIYRPEYYQIEEDEEGNSLKGIGEIIIAKHRNGALETVRLKWKGQYAKFTNLDDQDFDALAAQNESNHQYIDSRINYQSLGQGTEKGIETSDSQPMANIINQVLHQHGKPNQNNTIADEDIPF